MISPFYLSQSRPFFFLRFASSHLHLGENFDPLLIGEGDDLEEIKGGNKQEDMRRKMVREREKAPGNRPRE